VAHPILALERCFTQKGHTVKVIAPASRAVSILGDRFIPIGKPRPIPTSGSIARITISVRLAATIKKVLTEEHFDIIHLHEPCMPMLCTAMLRFSETVNVATFHACHGRPGYNLGRPISTFFLNRRARKLSARIAVSRPAMEFAAKYIRGSYDIIPNGIDLEHFSPDVSPIEQYCDGKRNILFVGRLEARKGLIYLLRAYRRIKQEIPDSRLIVVGPGTRLRRKYEKWVKKSGLQDIVFVGYASYDDLVRFYQTADIFCSPATGRESFGIVLLEGMAMAKPVVATNIEGYASVVADGIDGLLVPPKNDRALARAIISLLNDKERCREMGRRGRSKAMEYRWEDISQKILSCYAEILNGSARKQSPEPKEISLPV
jgi:phosphatidylinositol alpha-mannosyltransferase